MPSTRAQLAAQSANRGTVKLFNHKFIPKKNHYSYPENFDFQEMHIRGDKVLKGAKRGIISRNDVCAFAALLKLKKIHLYGNADGFNVDFKNLHDAYHKAQTQDIADHDKLEELVKMDDLCYQELSDRRQKIFDRRDEDFDCDTLLRRWNFPEIPTS